MKIIGHSGTNGSGKDTIAEFLGAKYSYFVGSATNMLSDELERRGKATSRENKSALSAEWRRQYGMSAIVDKAYEFYLAHQDEYQGIIIGSLRHPGEVKKLHELGGTMVWFDADPRVRYDRVQSNAANRNRPAEDNITFEEFLVQQEREMHPVGDDATLNMAAVKDLADIVITNDGNDIEVFKQQAEQMLGFTS